MRWLRFIWFKILKLIGIPVHSIHKNCISKLEEQLSEIDDDEYFIALTMLDAGHPCEAVFSTLLVTRRKRAFIRKLKNLGIKGSSLEHLIEKYLEALRGSEKIDDLVTKANQEYLDALGKRNKNTI